MNSLKPPQPGTRSRYWRLIVANPDAGLTVTEIARYFNAGGNLKEGTARVSRVLRKYVAEGLLEVLPGGGRRKAFKPLSRDLDYDASEARARATKTLRERDGGALHWLTGDGDRDERARRTVTRTRAFRREATALILGELRGGAERTLDQLATAATGAGIGTGAIREALSELRQAGEIEKRPGAWGRTLMYRLPACPLGELPAPALTSFDARRVLEHVASRPAETALGIVAAFGWTRKRVTAALAELAARGWVAWHHVEALALYRATALAPELPLSAASDADLLRQQLAGLPPIPAAA